MKYIQQQDEFGRVIEEGLSAIVEVSLSAIAVRTNTPLTPPEGTFGIVVKRCPVETKLRVNGNAFTVDEGDKISPFVVFNEVSLSTTSTSESPIVLQYLI